MTTLHLLSKGNGRYDFAVATKCKATSDDGKQNGRFTDDVKADVAARSAYFCNNPQCNRLLRAPLDQNAAGPLKLGQVAHIYGNRHGSERHQCHEDPSSRANPDNAIFLCAACHDMIDKRGAHSGASGFSALEILSWRDTHYALVQEALTGSYDLFSLVRRQSQAAADARALLTDMNNRRVFFDPPHDEDWSQVVQSLGEFRSLLNGILRNSLQGDPVHQPATEIQSLLRKTLGDLKLQKNGLAIDEEEARDFLRIMRRRLGKQIDELARVSGMPVPGNLHSVLAR
ncbi:hypothetical protein [Pseudarthrobacter niigatensis]|uniref:HNH endonuclease n=1 Tax=Pseudarthrobacter niigatensis TaxID=369935 RepID=A0AAJ1STS8_9MICC|nr:hypothetical protein [Pseudarthrobacter niigatensis]MDQ0144711.1 hypothetical protein [Pseudarthrobacter niigatensis]MDQ0265357.1 hypothetical protein [Pseudarthrobacter niigatensis]